MNYNKINLVLMDLRTANTSRTIILRSLGHLCTTAPPGTELIGQQLIGGALSSPPQYS